MAESVTELVGPAGSSRKAAVLAFAAFGVPVSPETIPDIRRRREGYAGNRIFNHFRLSQFRLEDNPGNKIEFYRCVGEAGMIEGRSQLRRPYRLSTTGFDQRIAQRVGIPHRLYADIPRAIRADICFTDLFTPLPWARGEFHHAATQFIDAYTKSPQYDVSKNVLEIARAWDGITIAGFYRALYQETIGAGIAALDPYESSFFFKYFDRLRRESAHLSAFDQFSLTAAIETRCYQYAQLARNLTGIPIDDSVIASHVRALIDIKKPALR